MRPESAYSTHTANSRAGGTICRVRAGMCICLHESGMLRRTHQLSCILKAKLAGKSHAGRLFQPVCGIPRRMTSALASSDLCEQLAALLLGDAPREDAIGATADRVSPSQQHYVLSGYISSGRILSFRWSRISEIRASGPPSASWMWHLEVFSDLGDPCIGVLNGAHNPWRTP